MVDFLEDTLDYISDFFVSLIESNSIFGVLIITIIPLVLIVSLIRFISEVFTFGNTDVNLGTLKDGEQYVHYFGNTYVVSHKNVKLTKKGYKVYISNNEFEYYPEFQYIGTKIIHEGEEVPNSYEKALSESI